MGNTINWFKELELFVLFRRPRGQTPPDPDIGSPANDNSEQTNPSTTTAERPLDTITQKCSPFYMACRNNDVRKVKKLLKTLSGDDIDRMEPVGSTALHVAAYRGHKEIVSLLLKQGANRAILNKYGCLPFDEATDPNVKEIFFRVQSSNRLVSREGFIEWERMDGRALHSAIEEREYFKFLYNSKTTAGTNGIRDMFEQIEKNYIGKSLAQVEGIDKISRFFRRASEEEDPVWIITAYTAETEFYAFLNREMAMGSKMYESERKYLMALLLHHPKLDRFSYIGVSYRTMEITDSLLQRYRGNEMLMTKTLISSSIEARIAIWFTKRTEGQSAKNESRSRFSSEGKLIQQWVCANTSSSIDVRR